MSGLASDLAGFKARGADVLALAVTRDQGLDSLDVRVPSAASTTLGVRDIVAKARTFATDIAYSCHDDSLFNFTRGKARLTGGVHAQTEKGNCT
jgi:hypothetical protein